MRALSLVLLVALALSGCATPDGVYNFVRPAAKYTGYAISTNHLIGIIHSAPRIGDVVYVLTMRGKQRAVIVAKRGDAIIMEGKPDPLDLRGGDSGAVVIAVLEGRIRQ